MYSKVYGGRAFRKTSLVSLLAKSFKVIFKYQYTIWRVVGYGSIESYFYITDSIYLSEWILGVDMGTLYLHMKDMKVMLLMKIYIDLILWCTIGNVWFFSS
jgi:hypothetical protein